MVNTGLNAIFVFILKFSKVSVTNTARLYNNFFEGLKNIPMKTHSELTNRVKTPLLRCHHHIFLGSLLKPCWHLGNEEKYYLPWENFLNSPSWLNCSLFYIPPALCSTMITVPNAWFLSAPKFSICTLHFLPKWNGSASRTRRVMHWCLYSFSSWHLSCVIIRFLDDSVVSETMTSFQKISLCSLL